jgi:NHLM bacteriocin system ABC transporter ATP-binding protein
MPDDARAVDALDPLPLVGTGALEVVAGSVAVFVRADGGRREPVAEVAAGEAIARVAPDRLPAGVEALAVGLPGARVRELAQAPDGGTEAWAARLGEAARRAGERDAERERRAGERAALDAGLPVGAVALLGSVFGGPRTHSPTADHRARLQLALDEIGRVLGVTFPRVRELPLDGTRDPLTVIGESSPARLRGVALPEGWWRETSGPLLVHRRDGGGPVAVLPAGMRRYHWIDPDSGRARPVDAAFAATVAPRAVSFYRPLPAGRVSLAGLVRFAFQGTGRSALAMLAAGLVAAVAALVLPVITGLVFDRAIPESRPGLLAFLIAIALSGAIAIALLSILRGLATLRLTGLVEATVQPALWDRLLRLPAGFFRGYTAGDLANRVNGVDTIRQVLTGQAIGSLLTLIFSVVSLALLFVYAWQLALVAVGAVAVLAVGLIALNLWRVSYIRRVMNVQGAVSGRVFQLLEAVPKLRVAAAEERALADWARLFHEQVHAGVTAGRIGNWLTGFGAALTMLVSLLIYWFAAGPLDGTLEPGAFLAFAAALGTFVGALTQFNGQLSAMVECVPLYERFVPITSAPPERAASAVSPGTLSGALALECVSFRYPEGDVDVLHEVTLRAQPGEFVAVTGPSGAGKSTILRLLLGFETPTRGTVVFDDHDLAGLEVGAVRRQVGVVLQASPGTAGTLLELILGDSGAGEADAWRAAEAAQLADEIRALPMGMQTIVTDGGSVISGGQLQRLNIARALVGRPRIVLLDEATSALDNRTQAAISRALDELDATRVVIAHRLSTIRAADRIYVLDAGSVVQEGTYDELMAREGLFRRLVTRQLAGDSG